MPRFTKILATIGPASRSQAAIRALIDAGVDAFRLNFSYGSHQEHAEAVASIRQASQGVGRPVAIVQDLQGPKIRVGRLANGPHTLEDVAEVILTTKTVVGKGVLIPLSPGWLPDKLKAGDRIILGDGEAELQVLTTSNGEVRAKVVQRGSLKENQGVKLPDAALGLPNITEKDLADLKVGLQLGVDAVALSFVRSANDMRRLKRAIQNQGSPVPTIAKLEKQRAIDDLGDILAVANGVMVARGDLGLELPPEKVPLLQKRIIREANQRTVLVITATQMLESMVASPRPTRAEASDVCNAILDGTDAVMLSGETAIGHYPVEAVRIMGRIAEEAEGELASVHEERPRLTHAHAMSRAARQLANDVKAGAIVVFTRSGYSAHLVSKERPQVPIFAFTPNPPVAQQLALWWGITPLSMEFPPSVEEMIAQADRHLIEKGLLHRSDTVVVARWSPLRTRGWSNFVKVHRLGTAGGSGRRLGN